MFASLCGARGAVWHVRQDGSGDFTTIQACVISMAPGDTCLVGAGVYPERVSFPAGKSGRAGALTIVKAETNLTVDTWGFDTTGCDYAHIEGFNVSVPAIYVGWRNGVGIYVGGNHDEVVSNYLHDILYPAISGSGTSDDAYIAGNHVYHSAVGMYIDGNGWLVERNEVERPQYTPQVGDADFSRFFGTSNILRSNYFHGCIKAEIGPAHVDGFQTYDDLAHFVQHTRIEANRLEGYWAQGVIMEAVYYTNSFDIVICNNIFNGENSNTDWGVFASTNIRDVQVYNNDFVNLKCGIYTDATATGDIRNNIFYGFNCFSLSSAQFTGGNNLLDYPGGSESALYPGDLINVDPRFVSVANNDFHLLPGSPAIDAGVPLTNVLYDADSVARPQGAGWDIGAYENVAGALVIIAQPAGLNVFTGSNASFSVAAAGLPPLGYQWRFNGTKIVNGGQFSGAATTALSLSNAQPANSGGYTVIVTNVSGSVTSAVANLTVNPPPTCIPPRPGLVGWWPGDANANDIAGTNNGSLQGGATAGFPGLVGSAFNFDGASGYVQVPDSSYFHPSNLTVEAWVRFTSLDSTGSGGSPAGDQYIVFKQNSQSGNFEGFDLSKTRLVGGDVFQFLVSSSAGVPVELDSVTTITPGVWYHVAGVRGSNYMQLYVNGQLERQAAVSFPQDYGSLPLYFGTSGESYWDHKFYGALDEVSLYNRTLSAGEIAAIYAANYAGKCKGATGPTPSFYMPPVQQPGTLSFMLSGQVGRSYRIDTSPDMQHWSPLSTQTLSSITIQITQPAPTGRQFYRAMLLP